MNKQNPHESRRLRRDLNDDEDDTLREIGEEHDFAPVDDDEVEIADRRRDPLRLPH
ncbi:MAG TPA: hypothetical protein VJ853_00260 [Thermoanaerobaculia bacterium]|nr:hypothetical protein [Thermoanaerobaculia bacterium]